MRGLSDDLRRWVPPFLPLLIFCTLFVIHKFCLLLSRKALVAVAEVHCAPNLLSCENWPGYKIGAIKEGQGRIVRQASERFSLFQCSLIHSLPFTPSSLLLSIFLTQKSSDGCTQLSPSA